MIKKWDSTTTTRFVQEYAKHTCLWDVNNENYKSRAARDAAVQDIVCNMGMSDLHPNDVKCKIRIIRNTYINEMKKIREKKRLVGGKHVSYVCNIPWFKTADQFLRKVVRKKKYPTNLVSLDDKAQEPEFDHSDLYEEGNFSGQEFAHDLLSISYQNNTEGRYPNAVIKDESQEDSEIEEMSQHSMEDESMAGQSLMYPNHLQTEAQSPLSFYSSHLSPPLASSNIATRTSSDMHRYENNNEIPPEREKNEFDMFAENVGAQLKKLPLENALEVQAKIHDLLIRERLKVIKQSKRNTIVIENDDGECDEYE